MPNIGHFALNFPGSVWRENAFDFIGDLRFSGVRFMVEVSL